MTQLGAILERFARLRTAGVVLALAAILLPTTGYATSPPMYLIHFPTDDVGFDEKQKGVLDQVIKDFQMIDGGRLTVTGHYDRTGTQEHRLQMSRRFAEAVTAYLLRKGVQRESVRVSWRADEEPAVPTADNVYELANRHVLIVIELPH